MKPKIVLAYSGGLDTSVILKWLQIEKKLDVIAFIADIGQKDELKIAKSNAVKMGAKKVIVADLKNIFVVNPNGETKTINSSSPLSFVILDNDVQLIYPGSIIYIPQSAKLMNPAQAASIWAPIISSIALSLTSLSVLNNNN